MGHSETDCQTVIEHLFLYIDGEIAGAECVEIEAHLEICARCLHQYGFEREIKLLVRRKCSEQNAPPEIVAKLKARLNDLRNG